MIGTTISHYRILERIGSGGMGVVYKAEDTRIGKLVAIKVLPEELTGDDKYKRRFIREAQAAFSLEHPNICNIHEIDEGEDGRLFICMGYYDGESLRERLDRGPVPVQEALRIAIAVADGLAKAHSEGVTHRDVKPANILVTKNGDVKILDFGLAKLAGRTRMTQTGTSLGTVDYMSPEQANGEEVDARTDIFSLGAVIHEAVTGRSPFHADHPAAVMFRILRENPAPIRESCPDCPLGLQRVVDKCLQKDRDQRYQSVEALRADLERIRHGTLPAIRRARFRSRLPRPAIAVISVAIALAALSLSPAIHQQISGFLEWTALGGIQHVAILPFENVGGDADNQVFCDGLMQTLTSKLTQLERFEGTLSVIPASEVSRQGIVSAGEAATAFGVNLAITGSVQPSSDGIRLTMNLVSMDSDFPRQISSVVTDIRKLDYALLQDQTVLQLARMLDVELAPREESALAAGNTSEPRALDAYIRGHGFLQHPEEAGSIDFAIDQFTQAIEIDSSFALGYAGLGEAYWTKYELTEDSRWVQPALDNCQKAAGLDPDLAPVQIALGTVQAGTGNYEIALKNFRTAIELEPGNVYAYRGLAGTYARLGQFDEAESTYEVVLDARPEFWIARNDLARFYYQRGRYGDAAAEFRKLTRLTPDNVWAHSNLGAALYYQEKWAEAAVAFRRAMDISPSRAVCHNIATLEYIQGHYEEAIEMYTRSLEFGDEQADTWSGLGNSYYWAPGQRDKAAGAFERARDLAEELRRVNPRDPRVLSELASYHTMLGEFEQARLRLDESLAGGPDDPFVVYWAAHTCEQLGDRDAALEHLARALQLGYPLQEVLRDPFMENLRADQRFVEIARDARGE